MRPPLIIAWAAESVRRYLGDQSRVAAVGIVLLSRVYSVGLVAIAGSMSEGGWLQLTDAASPFAAWDAQWYIHIAETGYHREPLVSYDSGGYHDFAFFPLWPAVIRLGSLGFISTELAAVVLANLLFVAAGLLVFEVFRRAAGERMALHALGLFCFGPAAFVGSLAYSEPLFLVIAAGFFLPPSDSRGRPILAAAAQLARLTGVALAAAALVTLKTRLLPSLVTIAALALAYAAWLAFVAIVAGDPLGYLRGGPSWYTVSGDTGGLPSLIEGLRFTNLYLLVALPLTLALIAGAIALWREHRALAAYSVATILMTVLLANWVNWPRHSWVAFPAFLGLARWVPHRGRLPILGLFCIGQAILVVGTIRWASFPP